MRFKDEKYLWNADVEAIAEMIANKSKEDVLQVFDNYDVIKLTSIERPKVTAFNRLMFVLLFIPLATTAGIKWMMTGDAYLDTWAKKYVFVGRIFKIIGIDTAN